MAGTFPILSTRRFPSPLVLYSSSACPTMDVACLSNPTISTDQAKVELHRLTGGGSGGAAAGISENDINHQPSAAPELAYNGPVASVPAGQAAPSKVWQRDVPGKATMIHNDAATSATGTSASGNCAIHGSYSMQSKWPAKGASTSSLAASATQPAAPAPAFYVQPRPPETLAWSPDGQLFAFAASTDNMMLYSVHDGQRLLHSVHLCCSPSSESHDTSAESATLLYLLGWEELLDECQRMKRERCSAEVLEALLPRLPDPFKFADKPQATSNTFTNPFMHGPQKPYVPAIPFKMPAFPSLAFDHPASPMAPDVSTAPPPPPFPTDDDEDGHLELRDHAYIKQLEHVNQTLLSAGDETGKLHLFLGGAIHLGSIDLGIGTDIVSAQVAGTTVSDDFPITPKPHFMTTLSALVSVPIPVDPSNAAAGLPGAIVNAISTAVPQASDKGEDDNTAIVMRCSLEIPHFPSSEMALLARAASSMRLCLFNAFMSLDSARKAWEEARQIGGRWIDRLKDGDGEKAVPALQLLTLLLTGRPPNANLHEYFASKNTERNLDKWESAVESATTKARTAALQSVGPACERLLIWLNQIRGWANWPQRFGHLDLQLNEVEGNIALIKLILLRAQKLEAAAVQEQLGFRDFSGWLKFELERISNLESQTRTRVTPKHDVLAVMTYIKERLDGPTGHPLDLLLKVEPAQDTTNQSVALSGWIEYALARSSHAYLKQQGKDSLSRIIGSLREEADHLLHVIPGQDSGMEQDDLSSGVHGDQSQPEEPEALPPFILGTEVAFTMAPAQVILGESADKHPPKSAKPKRKSGAAASTRRRSSGPAGEEAASIVIDATELSLPFYVREAAIRLAAVLDHSFATVAKSATVREATPVVVWQPAEREEDDSLSKLGLARDPTKITSRLVKSEDARPEGAKHWIACETPPNTLLTEQKDAAFWIICVNGRAEVRAAAFALATSDGTPCEILDIEFFDDQEVVLLVRMRTGMDPRPRHILATVRYAELPLQAQNPKAGLTLPRDEHLPFLPLSRFHQFEASFEPLQLALNGKRGRRIGCVLGDLGRTLEVLDLEPEGGDDDDGAELGDGDDDDMLPGDEAEEELSADERSLDASPRSQSTAADVREPFEGRPGSAGYEMEASISGDEREEEETGSFDRYMRDEDDGSAMDETALSGAIDASGLVRS